MMGMDSLLTGSTDYSLLIVIAVALSPAIVLFGLEAIGRVRQRKAPGSSD
jgi:hypothetical protein